MSLGRSLLRISLTVICILIIVLVIIPLSYRMYNGFIAKNFYSRDSQPYLYILPVERKIMEIENQTQDNYKINYADFEIKLPSNSIKKIGSNAYRNSTYINIEYGKGITISTQPKDKNWEKMSFETYSKMLYMTPDQINFFSITKKNHEKYLLLNYKSNYKIHFSLGGIYKFETSNVKGFQFGNPNNTRKYANVEIFDKNDNQYELIFVGFSQKEIDYTLASIRFRENKGQQRPIK